jgi:dTMP kinase
MGLFITFEGPDGSGKSTQARLLAEWLRARGISVTETREPGGTELGEAIREVWLGRAGSTGTPLSTALLLSASRAELVSRIIRPALEMGRTVVADRYADSTIAYQGYGLGLALNTASDLARIATGGLTPDVSVYVDVDPAVGIARSARRAKDDWLDRRAPQFHRRVREGYLELIAQEPQRWICVDGDGSRESVHSAILRQLEPLLEGTVEAV